MRSVLLLCCFVATPVLAQQRPVAATASPNRAQTTQMYLKIDGIAGEARFAGETGLMPVQAFQHEVVSPRDAASGLPTGKRQHKPLTITKELDKATPMLYQALATGQRIPSVSLAICAPCTRDARAPSFTITMKDVLVTSIRAHGGALDPDDDGDGLPTEEVSFTYGAIVWTWGDTAFEDTWQSPR